MRETDRQTNVLTYLEPAAYTTLAGEHNLEFIYRPVRILLRPRTFPWTRRIPSYFQGRLKPQHESRLLAFGTPNKYGLRICWQLWEWVHFNSSNVHSCVSLCHFQSIVTYIGYSSRLQSKQELWFYFYKWENWDSETQVSLELQSDEFFIDLFLKYHLVSLI